MTFRLLFLTVVCAVPALFSSAQPEPSWAHKIDGGLFETWVDYYHPGPTMTTDSRGNVIVAGATLGAPVDLDDSPASYTLDPIGSNDSYVARYKSDGQISWGFRIGCTDFDAVTTLAVDTHDNIYISGWFDGPIDMDPGAGTTILTPGDGDRDIYIAKYDSTGQLLQAMQIVSEYVNPTPGYVYNMDFDSNDNLIVSGVYRGDFDLDPGAGFTALPQGAINNGVKSFVAKYSPAFALLNHWTLVPNSEQLCIMDMEVDSQDGIYITGELRGTCDFAPGPATTIVSTMNRCAFVARYSQDGTLQWVRKMENDFQSLGLQLVVTASDEVVIEGLFSGPASFPLAGGGTHTFNWSGDYWDLDMFMAAYDGQGGVRWAKYLPGDDNHPELTEMVYRPDDDSFYSTFAYCVNVNLDPGATNHTLTAPAFPAFGRGLMRYDNATGDFIEGHALAAGSMTRIYVALHHSDLFLFGNLGNTLDVDFTPGILNLTPSGSYSMFVAKYCQAPENLQINVAQGQPDTLDVCPGATATLTATGAYAFSWFATATGGSPLASNDTLQLPVDESRWIFLEGSNGTCTAQFRDSIFLRVNPAVDVQDAPVSTCAGEPVILSYTATGDAFDSNYPDAFTTGQAIAETGYVWLEATNTVLGCSVADSVLVTVNPLPETGLVLPTDTLCANDAIELSGGSPAGGIYSGTGVNASIFGPVAAGGTYTIAYTFIDTNGCENTATGDLQVDMCLLVDELSATAGIFYDPATHTVSFAAADPASYALYAADGRLIASGTTENSFSIERFPGGVYFVHTGKRTLKVLKN